MKFLWSNLNSLSYCNFVIVAQRQALGKQQLDGARRRVLDLDHLLVRGRGGLGEQTRLALELLHRLVVDAYGRIDAQRARELLLRTVALELRLGHKVVVEEDVGRPGQHGISARVLHLGLDERVRVLLGHGLVLELGTQVDDADAHLVRVIVGRDGGRARYVKRGRRKTCLNLCKKNETDYFRNSFSHTHRDQSICTIQKPLINKYFDPFKRV